MVISIALAFIACVFSFVWVPSAACPIPICIFVTLAYRSVYSNYVPESITWLPEGNDDKNVMNFEEIPRENVFVHWEKVSGNYGSYYKMLNIKGEYYWSNDEITHWLDAGMCDIENECLCTRKSKTGKVLCGKCPKTNEHRKIAESFVMVNEKV